MPDLFTVISDKDVMDQSQIALYQEGVILAAKEDTNFFVGSPLISQTKQGDGLSATFFKYAQLTGAGALTDGEEVTSAAVVDSKVTLTLAEYGNVVTSTALGDVVTGGRLNAALPELVGNDMGTWFDKHAISKLEASSNEYFINQASEAAITASDVMNKSNWEKAYVFLRNNKVRRLVDGLYVAVVHPHVLADLREASAAGDWTEVSKYQNSMQVLRNEVGIYKGFRVIETANVTTNADAGDGAVDTYHTSFFGYNALGLAISNSAPMRLTIKTGLDKLDRFVHFGWWGILEMGLIDTNASCIVTSASSFGSNS